MQCRTKAKSSESLSQKRHESFHATISDIAKRLSISESTISRQVARLDGLRALDLVQKGKTKAVSIALTGKILLYGREHEYHLMTVKARYEDNVLKPLEKLDLADGEMVEIEIIKSNADRLIGLLKDIDVDSVDLQHAARDIWVRKVVSD